MCLLTKCPYVPPHAFDLDFPHLMLRYKAVAFQKAEVPFTARQITRTDRNGQALRPVDGLVNWVAEETNTLTRPVLEAVLGLHREAKLPRFEGRTLALRAKSEAPTLNVEAPAFGRKVMLYATCFSNFKEPGLGIAARKVLAHNGVETEIVYPSCCGMPQMEHGYVERVAATAKKVAAKLQPHVAAGKTVIALIPSCALMLKSEWPLLVPDDENVQALAAATRDIDEYVVGIAKTEGLADGLQPRWRCFSTSPVIAERRTSARSLRRC